VPVVTVSAYKIGTRVSVRGGQYSGGEAIILSRQRNAAPEPAFEYSAGSACNPQAFPSRSIFSWTYRVRLVESGDEIEVAHAELTTTQVTEWEPADGQ